MTQEDKKLLLQDLAYRLPCGVFIQVHHCKVECRHHLLGVNTENNTIRIDHCNESNETLFISNWMSIDDCKPYLRPMSSMTSDEWIEWCDVCLADDISWVIIRNGSKFSPTTNRTDWLNAHHFDYRGLIPMGLALEAPEDMYKN